MCEQLVCSNKWFFVRTENEGESETDFEMRNTDSGDQLRFACWPCVTLLYGMCDEVVGM